MFKHNRDRLNKKSNNMDTHSNEHKYISQLIRCEPQVRAFAFRSAFTLHPDIPEIK